MRKYLYIIICIAALAACKREIDFDFREVEPILTIEGRVTDEGTEVLLTRSRSVYDAAKPKELPGAQVIVSADGLQVHLTRGHGLLPLAPKGSARDDLPPDGGPGGAPLRSHLLHVPAGTAALG